MGFTTPHSAQFIELMVPLRLAAGAMAGMTATALTHPLDVMRLRLALPQSPYTGTYPRQLHLSVKSCVAKQVRRVVAIRTYSGQLARDACASYSSFVLP